MAPSLPVGFSSVNVNWLILGGILSLWYSTRRCLWMRTYLGHLTNLVRSVLGCMCCPGYDTLYNKPRRDRLTYAVVSRSLFYQRISFLFFLLWYLGDVRSRGYLLCLGFSYDFSFGRLENKHIYSTYHKRVRIKEDKKYYIYSPSLQLHVAFEFLIIVHRNGACGWGF